MNDRGVGSGISEALTRNLNARGNKDNVNDL